MLPSNLKISPTFRVEKPASSKCPKIQNNPQFLSTVAAILVIPLSLIMKDGTTSRIIGGSDCPGIHESCRGLGEFQLNLQSQSAITMLSRNQSGSRLPGRRNRRHTLWKPSSRNPSLQFRKPDRAGGNQCDSFFLALVFMAVFFQAYVAESMEPDGSPVVSNPHPASGNIRPWRKRPKPMKIAEYSPPISNNGMAWLFMDMGMGPIRTILIVPLPELTI